MQSVTVRKNAPLLCNELRSEAAGIQHKQYKQQSTGLKTVQAGIILSSAVAV